MAAKIRIINLRQLTHIVLIISYRSWKSEIDKSDELCIQQCLNCSLKAKGIITRVDSFVAVFFQSPFMSMIARLSNIIELTVF